MIREQTTLKDGTIVPLKDFSDTQYYGYINIGTPKYAFHFFKNNVYSGKKFTVTNTKINALIPKHRTPSDTQVHFSFFFTFLSNPSPLQPLPVCCSHLRSFLTLVHQTFGCPARIADQFLVYFTQNSILQSPQHT